MTLEAGPEKAMPVSLRWVVEAEGWPEAVAVEDGVVYVAGGSLAAFHLSDGTAIWEAPPEGAEGLHGSGWVRIGTRGADEVQAWAPYEYDLTVKRSDGDVVQFTRGLPPHDLTGFTPFPEPEPERFAITTDLEQIVARDHDGSVAWRITVDEPMCVELPPIGVPGGVVITTSSGHVLMIDYV